MAVEIQERTFDAGVVTINYAASSSSGPPLVILHGGSGRWQYYQDILPDLAARFRLYAPDFRGHGRSGRVPGRYRFQDYVDDTITFLRRCVAEPAYLFGHSLGGMVALMVAAQAPHVVRALVVGDSPLTPAGITVSGRTRPRLEAWRDLAGGRLSIVHRKALTPMDVADEETLSKRILDFQDYYQETAKPFDCNFTTADLKKRLDALKDFVPA